MRNQAPGPRRRAALPPGSLWQLLVVACLLTGSLTDAWRVVHLLTERHVACPYDGVPVHADDLSTNELGAAPLVPSAGTKHASVVPRHEHGSCGALAAADRASAVADLAALCVAEARHAERSPLPPVVASVTRAVLTYAPKLPPPA